MKTVILVKVTLKESVVFLVLHHFMIDNEKMIVQQYLGKLRIRYCTNLENKRKHFQTFCERIFD